MWLFVLFLMSMTGGFVGGVNQYCADMKPQNSVNIDQLMGMWYGIEILSHKIGEEGITEYYHSCPVIILKEEEAPTTVPAFGYGAEYGYGGDEYGKTYSTSFARLSTTPKPTTLYDQQRYGSGIYTTNSAYFHRHHRKEDLRKLTLDWQESGENIEYTLKYNTSRTGYWISSGPQNGSMLAKQYSQFAGTIQVMKAVGNHLVLTFCHRVPDKQIFSVILARVPNLNIQVIHGVHNLLKRRNFTIGNIRKVCNNNGSVRSKLSSVIVIVLCLLWYRNLSSNH